MKVPEGYPWGGFFKRLVSDYSFWGTGIIVAKEFSQPIEDAVAYLKATPLVLIFLMVWFAAYRWFGYDRGLYNDSRHMASKLNSSAYDQVNNGSGRKLATPKPYSRTGPRPRRIKK